MAEANRLEQEQAKAKAAEARRQLQVAAKRSEREAGDYASKSKVSEKQRVLALKKSFAPKKETTSALMSSATTSIIANPMLTASLATAAVGALAIALRLFRRDRKTKKPHISRPSVSSAKRSAPSKSKSSPTSLKPTPRSSPASLKPTPTSSPTNARRSSISSSSSPYLTSPPAILGATATSSSNTRTPPSTKARTRTPTSRPRTPSRSASSSSFVSLAASTSKNDEFFASTLGATPLHDAARANQVSEIQSLVARGANVVAVDNQGRCPVHYAATTGSVEALGALLGFGAKVSTKDSLQRSALYYLAEACVRGVKTLGSGDGTDRTEARVVVDRALRGLYLVAGAVPEEPRLRLARLRDAKGTSSAMMLIKAGKAMDELTLRVGADPASIALAQQMRLIVGKYVSDVVPSSRK